MVLAHRIRQAVDLLKQGTPNFITLHSVTSQQFWYKPSWIAYAVKGTSWDRVYNKSQIKEVKKLLQRMIKVGKIVDFRHLSSRISETVQDRHRPKLTTIGICRPIRDFDCYPNRWPWMTSERDWRSLIPQMLQNDEMQLSNDSDAIVEWLHYIC